MRSFVCDTTQSRRLVKDVFITTFQKRRKENKGEERRKEKKGVPDRPIEAILNNHSVKLF